MKKKKRGNFVSFYHDSWSVYASANVDHQSPFIMNILLELSICIYIIHIFVDSAKSMRQERASEQEWGKKSPSNILPICLHSIHYASVCVCEFGSNRIVFHDRLFTHAHTITDTGAKEPYPIYVFVANLFLDIHRSENHTQFSVFKCILFSMHSANVPLCVVIDDCGCLLAMLVI